MNKFILRCVEFVRSITSDGTYLQHKLLLHSRIVEDPDLRPRTYRCNLQVSTKALNCVHHFIFTKNQPSI
jgi:hypothetical protein